jgi:ribokinase
MPRIAVIGGIVADIAVKTARLPHLTETFLADSFKLGPGGKGANAAVEVARAGAEAVLIGSVGDDDFGHMILAHLRREGVDVNGISVAPAGISTGMGIAMITNDGENTTLGVMGANDHLSAQAVTESLNAYKNSLNAILINFEVPEDAVAAAVETGSRLGIPVIVDAGPARAYRARAWAKCTILTPNIQEIGVLAGYDVSDEATCEKATQELLAMGPSAVVLHRGARGALITTNGKCVEVPAFSVEAIDMTGAGDAFSGTLAVAVAQGMSLEQAVYRANAAGALAVTRLGTMPIMPTSGEIDRFLEEVAHQTQGRNV